MDDFGVDQDAEFDVEDNVPLAEFVRRRHELADDNDGK